MKKIILLFIGFISVGTFNILHAQTQRGNILVGGDIADFRIGLNSGSPVSINLNPKAAFFIRDGVAIGPAVNFSLFTQKDYGGSDIGYGVSAFGRYYAAGSATSPTIGRRRAVFFVEANVGINGVNFAQGESTNGLGLGVGPGLAWFLTPNIGLEGLLKYDGIIGFGSAATTSALRLNVGFQIYLPSRTTRAAIGK